MPPDAGISQADVSTGDDWKVRSSGNHGPVLRVYGLEPGRGGAVLLPGLLALPLPATGQGGV